MQNLRPIELRIEIIISFQKLFRFAVRAYLPSFQTEHLVGSGYRVHPVCDKEDYLLVAFLQKVLHHEGFIFRIELVGPFVEYEDGAVLKDDSDDCKKLVLSTR